MYNTLQSGMASAERVFDLLDEPEESPDRRDSELPRRGWPGPRRRARRVRARELCLPRGHPGDQGPVAGGRTGQHGGDRRADRGRQDHPGEPADAVLRSRFGPNPHRRGRYHIRSSRHSLRSRIGMVLQDTWLFDGTIAENIAYGRPEASEDEVVAAAKAAYVDRFVRTLPAGYQTRVSGDGANLSAGEKQLITIARAFLPQPQLLILDEATSSVDTRTEALISARHPRAAPGSNGFYYRAPSFDDPNMTPLL